VNGGGASDEFFDLTGSGLDPTAVIARLSAHVAVVPNGDMG
jgi:hypothetical protein